MMAILFQVAWLNARHLLPPGALALLAAVLSLVCACALPGASHGP